MYFIILLIIIFSCIEPFRPDLNKNDLEYLLVTEGKVTDECGPFKVRLSKSGEVYTYQTTNSFEPIPDAEVQISDDKGNIYPLYHVGEGWYETIDKCLQGVPGNIYTLHITDNEDEQYESTPELMSETPSIDSVYYEEEQKTHIEGESVLHEGWLNILLNTRTSTDGEEYFKWEFEETWEFTMPEYIPVLRKNEFNAWYSTMETVYITPEKFHCWISINSKSILIKSTTNNQSGEIRRLPLTSIGPDDDRLSIRYSILIKQYTLNNELYDFFKVLESLNETNGGMYDRIPTPLFGNIQSSSSNRKAIGYFFASTVKTKRLFIDNKDTHIETGSAYSDCGWKDGLYLESGTYYFYGTTDYGQYSVWSGNKYCTDCRERGTNVKPDFW